MMRRLICFIRFIIVGAWLGLVECNIVKGPGCNLISGGHATITYNDDKDSEFYYPHHLVLTHTFVGCEDELDEVTIEADINIVEAYSFLECVKLKKVEMKNISEVGEYAFVNLPDLEVIDMGSSPIETIGDMAFAYLRDMKNLYLPTNNAFKRIIYSAFRGSGTYMTSLSIPDSVEEISYMAFQEWENVSDFTLSQNARLVIGDRAFEFLGRKRNDKEKIQLNFNNNYLNISDLAFDGANLGKVFINARTLIIGDTIFGEALNYSDVLYSSNLKEFHRTQVTDVDNQIVLREEKNMDERSPYNYRCNDGFGHTPYRHNPTFFFCAPCEIGSEGNIDTVNSNNHRQECRQCQNGTYSDLVGSSKCTKCPKGKYSNVTGLTSADGCIPCKSGKYSFLGASQCEDCPPGYQCRGHDGHGVPDNKIVKCLEGKFAMKTGSEQCEKCPSGTFQNKEGQAFCSTCASGKFNPHNGSIRSLDCLDCPRGTFSPGSGASECIPCIGENTIASSPGMSACEPCDHQNIADDTKSECIPRITSTTSAIVEMFNDGSAMGGTFAITVFFVFTAGIVTYYREAYPSKLANYTRFEALYNSFLAGFGFGSSVFLIISISLANPGLGVAMILFRLLHFIGGAALLVVMFGSESFVKEKIDTHVEGASLVRNHLDPDIIQSHLFVIEMVSFAAMLDVTMFQFMPWKKSRFYVLSEGYPSLGVMKYCLCLKLVELLGIFACEVIYLSSTSIETMEEEALFVLNILFGVVSVFLNLIVVLLRGRILESYEEEKLPHKNDETDEAEDPEVTRKTSRRVSQELELGGIYSESATITEEIELTENPLNADYTVSKDTDSKCTEDARDALILEQKRHIKSRLDTIEHLKQKVECLRQRRRVSASSSDVNTL